MKGGKNNFFLLFWKKVILVIRKKEKRINQIKSKKLIKNAHTHAPHSTHQ